MGKSLMDRAFSTPRGRRRHRSVFDRALGGHKKRRGRGGMAGAMTSLTNPKLAHGLEKHLDLPSQKRKKTKDRGMARDVVRSLKDRLTPTERAEIRREVDESIERDQWLRSKKAEAGLTEREGFFRRLVRIARERLGRA